MRPKTNDKGDNVYYTTCKDTIRKGEFSMRIGFFTDSYFPQVSGVSTSIRVLKEELEARGHEVIIFTTTDPKADPEEENIVRLTSIPLFSFKDRRIAIKGFNKALREARQYHIDIVHTHTEFSMGLTGKYVAYMLNIPTVHTYHTMYEKYLHYIAKGKVLKPKSVEVVSRLFCNRTMGVIAPSQMMKEKLASYNIYKEIRVIPTGVPLPNKIPGTKEMTREKLGIYENDLVLLSLSRLAFEKHLEKIMEAFPDVLKKYPNAKLIFVGDGPARESLEKLSETLQAKHSIIFIGEVRNEEVNEYYQMADLYVNASESETQGLTYLESIVNGCPVVAKRNDYLEEIICSPILGSLFDKDEEFAECIIETLDRLQKEDNQLNRKEGLELMQDISSKTFANKVSSYYRDIIENYYIYTVLEDRKTFPPYMKIIKTRKTNK